MFNSHDLPHTSITTYEKRNLKTKNHTLNGISLLIFHIILFAIFSPFHINIYLNTFLFFASNFIVSIDKARTFGWSFWNFQFLLLLSGEATVTYIFLVCTLRVTNLTGLYLCQQRKTQILYYWSVMFTVFPLSKFMDRVVASYTEYNSNNFCFPICISNEEKKDQKTRIVYF